MLYEICINIITGAIGSARPAPFAWKKKELEELSIVEYSGTKEDVSEITNGEYRYVNGKFIHVDTTDEFDHNIVLKQIDAPTFTPVIETVATELDPDWAKIEPDVCKFLHPDHLEWPKDGNFMPIRKYWFNKFRKVKELEGVREFMAAILYRDYGNIAEAGKALPKETKAAIFANKLFTPDDISWMRWTWRVK